MSGVFVAYMVADLAAIFYELPAALLSRLHPNLMSMQRHLVSAEQRVRNPDQA